MGQWTYKHGVVASSKNLTTTEWNAAQKTKRFVDVENVDVRFDDGTIEKFRFESKPMFDRGDVVSLVVSKGRTAVLVNTTRGSHRVFPGTFPIGHWVWWGLAVALSCVAWCQWPVIGFWPFVGLVFVSFLGCAGYNGIVSARTLQAMLAGADGSFQSRQAPHHAPAPSAPRVTPAKGLVCAGCGAPVGPGVVDFCAKNAPRFGGQVLCMGCQKNH